MTADLVKEALDLLNRVREICRDSNGLMEFGSTFVCPKGDDEQNDPDVVLRTAHHIGFATSTSMMLMGKYLIESATSQDSTVDGVEDSDPENDPTRIHHYDKPGGTATRPPTIVKRTEDADDITSL